MSDPLVLARVHEGWDQLRLQRPLAAWACWQQALRFDPENQAARNALETLESAQELPAAARSVYRFLAPSGPERRGIWNQALKVGGLENLEIAAEVFSSLFRDHPDDHEALLNLALCQAWLGQNARAIQTLDCLVDSVAPENTSRAADAWLLAEVLRFGSGAEAQADDLRYVWTVRGRTPAALLSSWQGLRKIRIPKDPLTAREPLTDGDVFEWLDPRSSMDSTEPSRRGSRVLATVVVTSTQLRLSTPDPSGLELLDSPRYKLIHTYLKRARREASPLPIAWADAALGTIRFPADADDEMRRTLAREEIEQTFEDRWIHQPRHSLQGRTPSEAAFGDAVMLARLDAVIRFREQLAARPTHAGLYQGYPFDRLRRRLGRLTPESHATLDVEDVSCMSRAELLALPPSKLDCTRLSDALDSAIGLRDDEVILGFSREMLERGEGSPTRSPLLAAVAPLIRVEARRGEFDEALSVLENTRTLGPSSWDRFELEIWSAEIQARAGRPRKALAQYRKVLEEVSELDGFFIATDGVETLIDNQAEDEAADLLEVARTRLTQIEDPELEELLRTTLLPLDNGGPQG